MIPRINRVGAWCGLAFLVMYLLGLWVFSGFVPAHDPAASAEQIAAIYRRNTTGIKLGMAFIMFAPRLPAMGGHRVGDDPRHGGRIAFPEHLSTHRRPGQQHVLRPAGPVLASGCLPSRAWSRRCPDAQRHRLDTHRDPSAAIPRPVPTVCSSNLDGQTQSGPPAPLVGLRKPVGVPAVQPRSRGLLLQVRSARVEWTLLVLDSVEHVRRLGAGHHLASLPRHRGSAVIRRAWWRYFSADTRGIPLDAARTDPSDTRTRPARTERRLTGVPAPNRKGAGTTPWIRCSYTPRSSSTASRAPLPY